MTGADTSNAHERDLVANLGWVQRIALSLARDRDAADDLAQDVARVWLEKRPVLAHGPRAWLGAVLRRLALDRARSEAGRRARERSAARPERADEPFEVVERGARQRRVVELVLELPEPYRSTLLYRYLDGLATRAVAERMGVPEPTVRKRIERGLALLRERLEREVGSRSKDWLIALLEPGLGSALAKGIGIMSLKSFLVAAGCVLAAGAAWYWTGSSDPDANEPIGGKGVVVPLEVALEREKPPLAAERTPLAVPEPAARVVEPAPASPAARPPGLRGYVYVDGAHRAPPGLSITTRADTENGALAASVDEAAASWSLDDVPDRPLKLWITSRSTSPALVPVPRELCASGGVLDLYLSTDSSLVLTFLDRETRKPLADLAFTVSVSIALERRRSQVLLDGAQHDHRTDANGMAEIAGLPPDGYVSVLLAAEAREEDVLMRDGKVVRMQSSGEPIWSLRIPKDAPSRIEETILTSAPLGEACAPGQVPSWAALLARDTGGVRVVARDTTNETPQRRGMAHVLAQDEQGRFELCASAPGTQAIWLETVADRRPISEETRLELARPGPQDPVVFRARGGSKLVLRFVNVPAQGEVEALVLSPGASRAVPEGARAACAGQNFTREVAIAAGDELQVRLRLEAGPGQKAAWMRRFRVDPARDHELTIDLGGTACQLSVECAAADLQGDGELALVRCNGNEVADEFVMVPCAGGHASARVHVPGGRWLYRYTGPETALIWGVVEIDAAHAAEVVLRPRVRLAAAEELGAAIRFDEVEGVSLATLPEKMRTFHVPAAGARIAVPSDARFVVLDSAK